MNGAGTLALSTGPVSAPDGKVISHYYSTWRRDADGHWRVVFDNGYDACDCSEATIAGRPVCGGKRDLANE